MAYQTVRGKPGMQLQCRGLIRVAKDTSIAVKNDTFNTAASHSRKYKHFKFVCEAK